MELIEECFFASLEALLENPDATKATLQSGWIHDIDEIEEELNKSYNGYHQYDWVRPRKTWLEAKCPVYIDFVTELLVKLEVYDNSGLECVRYVSKRKFIHDATTEINAKAIATRFYPI